MMEPWDGPASIAFTDGTVIGAVLDRNGLRPSRYYVTKDDLVIMASEVGVLDIPDENILLKERLHPGTIFLVDTEQGRIIADEEIKQELASAAAVRGSGSTRTWWRSRICSRRRCCRCPITTRCCNRQRTFGYTQEDLRILLAPMALNGEEAIGSMGTDTPLAVLSDRPRLLYDYFKQLFAQVTNPPLDAIREELVTSMGSTIGPEAQPAEAGAGSVPPDQDQVGHRQQRGAGEAAPHRRARLQVDHAADAVRRRVGRRRARAGARRSAAAHERGGRRGLHHHHPVGPRREHEARADSEPAGDGRRAPSSRPRRARATRGARRSKPATRAKCITLRCSSATAPARSIRTWRSRRSTT